MKEELQSWCDEFISQQSKGVPVGQIKQASKEFYALFVQRLFLKVTDVIEDSILEKLSSLFDQDDDNIILEALNKHMNIIEFSKEIFEEAKEIYLQKI